MIFDVLSRTFIVRAFWVANQFDVDKIAQTKRHMSRKKVHENCSSGELSGGKHKIHRKIDYLLTLSIDFKNQQIRIGFC